MSYNHGDVAMIYPKNSKSDVDMIMNILKLQPDSIIEIKSTGLTSLFPSIVKASDLFENYVNINGIPTRYF